MADSGKPIPVLSSIARDILVILEEAGEETLGCVVNTLVEHREGPGSLEMLREIERTLEAMVEAGHIEISLPESDRSLPGSERIGRLDLSSMYVYDAAKAGWYPRSETVGRMANATITSEGFELVHSILSELGWPSTLR